MTPLELLEEHGSLVRHLIRMHLGTGPDADDAYQEIYINLHRGWAGFRGASQARTWLYRVALNTLLTQHRRQAIRRTEPLENHEHASPVVPQHEQRDLLEKACGSPAPLGLRRPGGYVVLGTPPPPGKRGASSAPSAFAGTLRRGRSSAARHGCRTTHTGRHPT